MALYVNTNTAALNGQRNLANVTSRMNSSFEKLSSGSRINSAKDDAAGLQVSDRLTTQVMSLEQATRNANDGISIAQIAEGAMSEITNNFQRMRQLSVQGGNRTLSSDDREALSQEFEKLLNVNNDIADRTAFGTKNLLNYSSSSSGFQIQSGAQSGEQETVSTGNMMLTHLFGELLINDPVVVQSYNMSSFSYHNELSVAGPLGGLILAHLCLEGESVASAVLPSLFGLTRMSQFNGITLGELAGESRLQLDAEKLTELLTREITPGLSGTQPGVFRWGDDGNYYINFEGISIGLHSVGFDDSHVNIIHGFFTDTLLNLTSDLVTQVDRQRARLGAEQNGLMSTIRSNTTSVVNVSDARSRITDTDFARETSELTRNQIIQQASTSILAQANQLPQAALALLG